MANEILLYTAMYSWSIQSMIEVINQHMGEPLAMRVNSPGGDVFPAWGLYAKMAEHGDITVKVDGVAASAAWNLLLYAKKVESLDISMFMIHRADAYVSTPEDQALLNTINSSLRKKLEAKIPADSFKEVTGHTYDEIFNPETRLNVWLTPKQMQKLGIVSKINKLSPAEEKVMAEAIFKAAASIGEAAPIVNQNFTSTIQNMTLEKIKSENPVLYQQILAEGEKLGQKKERDRVGAWMAWAEIDQKKAIEGVNSGEDLGPKATAEFQVSAVSGERLKKLTGENAAPLAAGAAPILATDAKAKEIADFEASIDAELGLKKAK